MLQGIDGRSPTELSVMCQALTETDELAEVETAWA
jgi:hypothetical protein